MEGYIKKELVNKRTAQIREILMKILPDVETQDCPWIDYDYMTYWMNKIDCMLDELTEDKRLYQLNQEELELLDLANYENQFRECILYDEFYICEDNIALLQEVVNNWSAGRIKTKLESLLSRLKEQIDRIERSI